jgi:hypothetical protein
MKTKEKGGPRKRAQLSCDTCRRYKRKVGLNLFDTCAIFRSPLLQCDRACPCAECRFRGKACSFDKGTVNGTPSVVISPTSIAASPPIAVPSAPSVNDSAAVSSSFINSWNSPPDRHHPSSFTGQSTLNFDWTDRLESLVCSPNALHHIIAAWRREDDWYHEVILDSPFMTIVTQQHYITLDSVRRFAGVIYAIIALVAQTHPSELEAILIRLSSSSLTNLCFTSAEEVGSHAERASKAWLDRVALDSDASSWSSEFFQTSFLLTKLNKFTGRWVEYRERLGIDLARLQRANYHRLSGITQDKRNTYQELNTRHRIFWHYFTLERWVDS